MLSTSESVSLLRFSSSLPHKFNSPAGNSRERRSGRPRLLNSPRDISQEHKKYECGIGKCPESLLGKTGGPGRNRRDIYTLHKAANRLNRHEPLFYFLFMRQLYEADSHGYICKSAWRNSPIRSF